MLVLSELYYPGWRATLNGVSVPILKVDGGLRGIRVPAGSSVVRMHYLPVSVYGGLLLSVLTFAATGVVCYLWLRVRIGWNASAIVPDALVRFGEKTGIASFARAELSVRAASQFE